MSPPEGVPLHETLMVPVDALRGFCEALLTASGVPSDIGAEVAHHLVGSDAAGHGSHGVIHLPRYLREIDSGEIHPQARPTIARRSAATATVDGHWGFGHYAAKIATELSIATATEHGVSTVALVRTGHIGRLGEYTELAARRDCATIMLTAPLPGNQIVPPGGAEGALGTNPISVGFPDGRPKPFLLDFATSAISGGKVWLALQRGEQLPEDVLWAPDLTPTRDPAWLMRGALFPPFGGHKGYGLAVAIALLAGALTGGGREPDRPVAAGTLLITIHAGAFVDPGLVASIADSELSRIKGVRTRDPGAHIVIPGEPEADARAAAQRHGVPLTDTTRTELLGAARRLGVDPGPLMGQAPMRSSAVQAE
jgi:uncharacterized oxidoreductase